ncbi:MAG: right-handed parallel beta-helix repeat-containing protein [Opitutaceae bacterium]
MKISLHLRLTILVSAIFGLSPLLIAQTFHVRQGANGNGSDWNNAYGSLPSTLVRGATYYIADGSYPSYTFDDPNTGTSQITIKKATESEHGTTIGWSSSYGDGQASFSGGFVMITDYYVIDGSKRDESNWYNGLSYGFRLPSITSDSIAFGNASDHITVKYCDMGGNFSETYYSGMGDAIKVAYSQTDWTVSRCFIHNSVGTMVQFAGVSNSLVEFCWFGPSWGKVAIRGQVSCTNTTFRHNIFYNAAQTDPEDSTSGLTAEIALWDGPSWDNNEIYGNIFYSKVTGGRNTSILVGGNGSSWVGAGGANTKVYNNTFVGFVEPAVFPMILLNGSSTEAKNNLFFDCIDSDVSASSASNNLRATADPFVNLSSMDFRLHESSQARNSGIQLGGPPYDVDRLGNRRGADGAWDVGAYEFSIGIGVTPTAPSDLQIQ